MATSAVGAVVAKYATLTSVPTLYFGDAPTNESGVQVYPPYVVLLDEGMAPEYNFVLSKVMEPTQLTFMVYSDTLLQVDAIVQKIKYNGQVPSAKAGFDFGTLPALESPYELDELKRTSERRFVASIQGTGKDGQRVHGCELQYRVTLFLYGD